MIRFLVRGVLWVVLAWSLAVAMGAWIRGNYPQDLAYLAVSIGALNTLWIERRAHQRRNST